MKMKGLKENGQDKKTKLENLNLAQNSPKLAQARSPQRNSPKQVHSSEVRLFLVKLT